MFLTPSDLRTLTGYIRPSAQVRWLKKRGYRFNVNALGEPVVAVAEANRKLVGGTAARIEEPNWSAIHGPQAQA